MAGLDEPLRPYRFKLSLHLNHPKMRWEQISAALGLTPKVRWNAGDPRVTPKGTELGGTRDRTNWSCRIAEDNRTDEDAPDLTDAVEDSVSYLEAHKDLLSEFVATGGEMEYFVGWFTTDTSGGDTLRWELMQRMAALKINFTLDVYGNNPRRTETNKPRGL